MPALEPLLIFALFFAAGAARMPPSITFGDSGEFAAAAATLGLPHSPGYPLFCLLGKAFGTALPWGNWAYRTNLLSVLCSALAMAVLWGALRRAGFGLAARLCAALALSLTSVWAYETTVTEVFALNILALASLIWAAARFSASLLDCRPMAAMGLALGLGLANHHTLMLVAPAFILEGLASRPPPRRILRAAAVFALFVLLGMACYLFLPLRSAQAPPLDWGHPTDLHRFMRVLLRKDYGSFSLTTAGQQAGRLSRLSQVGRYCFFTAKELGWPAAAFGVLGYGAWRWLGLGLSWHFPLTALILTGPFFLVLGNPPFDAMTTSALERFYLGSWICLSLLIAAGAQLLEKIRPRASWAAVLLILAGGAAFGQFSARGELAAYDYGRNILRTLPPGASLYMDGGDDTFYSLAFLTYAQGRRADLDLHDRGGLVYKNPYGADFRALPPAQKEARRIETEKILADQGRLFYSTLNANLLPGHLLSPVGLLRKAGKGSDPWDLYPLRWSTESLRRHYRDRALVPIYPFMRAEALTGAKDYDGAVRQLRLAWSMGSDALWLKPSLTFALATMGYQAVQSAQWDLAGGIYRFAMEVAPEDPEPAVGRGVVLEKTGDSAGAEEFYRLALRRDPASAHAFNNLGALYWGRSRWVEAAEAFESAARLEPGNPAPRRFALEAARRAREKK